MIRQRADLLPQITEEKIKKCNIETVSLVEEYLETSTNLSKQTLKQYKSGLYQFTYYIYENLNDKPLHKITKRDFRRYISYLVSHGLSSSALRFKKSTVSAFCKYIENVIADEEANYKNFRNFTTGIGEIAKNEVYSKVPVTKSEYDLIINKLLEDENYMGAAWVAVAFNSGARRNEIRQLKTEIINYKSENNYILSNSVRGKGKGFDGKVIKYMINDEALKYIKLWIEKRSYEHEYIFTTKHKGTINQISEIWANRFCTNVLSDILGRRINPHLFKSSCVSYLVNEKKVDLKLVSKYIAHHEDISTTDKHYLITDDTEEMSKIFS